MPRKAHGPYVGPPLLALVGEFKAAIRDAQESSTGADAAGEAMGRAAVAWIRRIAQELEIRRQAALNYAEAEGATWDIRTRLERDELRAQIADFIEGVLS
jgi:hypothetical protein